MPFTFTPLELEGAVLVEPKVFGDARGFFKETFKATDFADAGLPTTFVQDNFSRSSKGVLRGLHFQRPPKAQGKLVMAITGTINDVIVDVRKESSTFGQHVVVELSEENHRMLWVPPGFAHGFITLSDRAEITYKCTDVYAPECDGGILWNDPALGIDWGDLEPLLSEKDTVLPRLTDLENNPF